MEKPLCEVKNENILIDNTMTPWFPGAHNFPPNKARFLRNHRKVGRPQFQFAAEQHADQ